MKQINQFDRKKVNLFQGKIKVLITIIISFSLTGLSGQTKSLGNVIDSNGDTLLWYKYQRTVINNLLLTRLETSSSNYYFRFWKTNQVLDIWKNTDNSLAGQLTTWVTERTPAKEKSTNRIQISKKKVQKDTVKLIYDLIEKYKVQQLPTDDSIKGWKKGFDGITYITEFASKLNYDFKLYWAPSTQDSTLQEAKFVQSFVDILFQSCNANVLWKKFEKTIPFECYTYGGINICKAVTKKERRKLVAERRNYRRFLNSRITKMKN